VYVESAILGGRLPDSDGTRSFQGTENCVSLGSFYFQVYLPPSLAAFPATACRDLAPPNLPFASCLCN